MIAECNVGSQNRKMGIRQKLKNLNEVWTSVSNNVSVLVDCCNKYTTNIFFYCLGYFQIQNTVLLNIVTMLYVIYFITGSLYLLNPFTPFIHLTPLPSGNHCSLYLSAWWGFFFKINLFILYWIMAN